MVHSLLLHVLIATLSLFLFIVFGWWWLKVKNTTQITKIYKINCWLMFGLFITQLLAAVKYALVMYTPLELRDVYTWWLGLQQYFLLFPLIAYLVHVINKLADNNKHSHYDERRRKDDL
jgi:hypothetical protein